MPSSMQTGVRKIGATVGLAAFTCSREDHKAEQVYVRLLDWSPTHPIQIDAWVGYSSIGHMNITKQQASDLIKLLLDALAEAD